MKEPPFKKFILFVMEDYYPFGGLNDILDSFDDLEYARQIGREMVAQWDGIGEYQIVDRDTWTLIEHGPHKEDQ